MWCAAKGIDCNYCGVFGECQRTCCGLPNAEPSTLGTSSSYLVNTTSEKLITDIKYEAVKEFAKEVKECKTIKELVELGYIASYVDVCKEIDELLKEY